MADNPLLNRVKKLPESPGVYFFVGSRKDILYIGKATSLRDRVRSYFSSDIAKTRGPAILRMLSLAKSIDFRKTGSALEALLLETDLIKKFQPKFNAKEKDDRSFNCVVITKEDFPQVLIVRKKDIDSIQMSHVSGQMFYKAIFGPFPQGIVLRDVLKIIRKIFPYRDAKCIPSIGKPCFNRQIGLCPGVCTGEVSKKEYSKTVKNIELFFEGKKSLVLSNLRKDMNKFAMEKEFEKAGKAKKQISSLLNIQETSLLSRSFFTEKFSFDKQSKYRIEAYDIAHTSGESTVGAFVSIVSGIVDKSKYRLFKIRRKPQINDSANLLEILDRRLKHTEWELPDLIVVDGNDVQKKAGEKAVGQLGVKIPIVAVTKNNRHKPVAILGDESVIKMHKNEILLANSEAHRFVLNFHRKKRGLLHK